MGDNRVLYIEESIIGAVKGLLSGRVNVDFAPFGRHR
jgi:hypothetical protein